MRSGSFAEPAMHYNENVADVNYEIQVNDKATRKVEILQKTHRNGLPLPAGGDHATVQGYGYCSNSCL